MQSNSHPLAGQTVTLKSTAHLIGGRQFTVQDYWHLVSGKSWQCHHGSIVTLEYAMRISQGDTVPFDDEVLSGTIDGVHYLIHVNEIDI